MDDLLVGGANDGEHLKIFQAVSKVQVACQITKVGVLGSFNGVLWAVLS